MPLTWIEEVYWDPADGKRSVSWSSKGFTINKGRRYGLHLAYDVRIKRVDFALPRTYSPFLVTTESLAEAQQAAEEYLSGKRTSDDPNILNCLFLVRWAHGKRPDWKRTVLDPVVKALRAKEKKKS